MLYEAIKLALQAILRNALRSLLTMMGIMIGVGAVIAMVTIGNGTRAKVAADLAKLGSNMLSVRPGQFGPGRASAEAKPFSIRDAEALKAQLRGVRAVVPTSQKATTVVYGSENRSTPVIGTAEEGTDTAKVQADMERLPRERRNITTGKEDDFSVRDMKQIAQTQTPQRRC